VQIFPIEIAQRMQSHFEARAQAAHFVAPPYALRAPFSHCEPRISSRHSGPNAPTRPYHGESPPHRPDRSWQQAFGFERLGTRQLADGANHLCTRDLPGQFGVDAQLRANAAAACAVSTSRIDPRPLDSGRGHFEFGRMSSGDLRLGELRIGGLQRVVAVPHIE